MNECGSDELKKEYDTLITRVSSIKQISKYSSISTTNKNKPDYIAYASTSAFTAYPAFYQPQ
jgi:hypothetical protein